MGPRRLAATDYTVGWLCALPIELAVAQVILDETHQAPPYDETDPNPYTFGRIGDHNVVLACLPAGQMGIGPAAVGATRLLSTFRSIRFGLMVGVGGGVPSPDADIRLGDVVISQRLVQYDYGKTGRNGEISRIGSLNAPPRALLNAVSHLRAARYQQRTTFEPHLCMFDQKSHFRRDSAGPDVLFQAGYHHESGKTCMNCDKDMQIPRSERQLDALVNIHYGTIASGNQVVKDGLTRDKLSHSLGGVLCFEMEAAGLMNDFPCLVVRGICDYADSHKNKTWQPYAAATASACAKTILSLVPAAATAPVEATKIREASDFKIPFILKSVPVGKMAPRPHDSEAIERALLAQDSTMRRRIMILHGLGGMGKTQLAVDFARRHKQSFSAVIWLDGSSESNLKQSIASCASRIPEGQIPEGCRNYSTQSHVDIDVVVKDVLNWLATPRNDNWLLVLDNVDRDYRDEEDPEAYDVETYFPHADHGAVLITTRLVNLRQLGEPREISKVDISHARAIFEVWYGKTVGQEADELLTLLDGLPLVLAQAAAYMTEHGLSFDIYTRLYKDQWTELMEHSDGRYSLRNYGNRSVATTWMISFKAIQKRDETAANLLLLWAHLDNGFLWHGLITHNNKDLTNSELAMTRTSLWIGDIAKKEMDFIKAMGLLRSYSLIEETEDQTGWTMHSVVHQWALHVQNDKQRAELSWIAIVLVGYATPSKVGPGFWKSIARYLPHVEMCRRILGNNLDIITKEQDKDDYPLICSISALGCFYRNVERWHQAAVMYKHALEICEQELGSNHLRTGILTIELSTACIMLDKVDDAERLAKRALLLMESQYGQGHRYTLNAWTHLGLLHFKIEEMDKAGKELQRAVTGLEKVCGPDALPTLNAVDRLGLVYYKMSMWDEAEKMYKRVLWGRSKHLGPDHPDAIRVCNDLGVLYKVSGRPGKAEDFLLRAQQAFDKLIAIGYRVSMYDTLGNSSWMCELCCEQGRAKEAKEWLERFERHVSLYLHEDVPENIRRWNEKLQELVELAANRPGSMPPSSDNETSETIQGIREVRQTTKALLPVPKNRRSNWSNLRLPMRLRKLTSSSTRTQNRKKDIRKPSE